MWTTAYLWPSLSGLVFNLSPQVPNQQSKCFCWLHLKMHKSFSVNLHKLNDHVSIVDLHFGRSSTCCSVWRSWSDHIYRDSVCACSCHSTVMVCSILSQYEREISRLLLIIGEHSMCEKICNVSFVACRIFNRRILFCIALLKAQKHFSNIPYYLCLGPHLSVIGDNTCTCTVYGVVSIETKNVFKDFQGIVYWLNQPYRSISIFH